MHVVPKSNWYLFGFRVVQGVMTVVGFWFGTAGMSTVLGWPGWLAALSVAAALTLLNWVFLTPAIKTMAAYLYVRLHLKAAVSLKEARRLAPHLNRDVGAARIDAAGSSER